MLLLRRGQFQLAEIRLQIVKAGSKIEDIVLNDLFVQLSIADYCPPLESLYC